MKGKLGNRGPGWAAKLVKVSFPYAKIVCLIPIQGTCKKQPINA